MYQTKRIINKVALMPQFNGCNLVSHLYVETGSVVLYVYSHFTLKI